MNFNRIRRLVFCLKGSQLILANEEQMDLIEEAVQYFNNSLAKYLLDPTKSDGSKQWARSKLQQLKPIIQSFDER